MHKLGPAIAGCLLLATHTGCAGQPVRDVASSNQQTADTMDDSSTRVAETATRLHNWNPADVVVTALPDGSAGGCELFGAYSNNALSASTKVFAVIDGERVIARGEPDALQQVLDACGDAASPLLWAQAVSAFAEGIRAGRVVTGEEQISSAAHQGAVERGGYDFHPPRLAADGAVEFFMLDMPGGELFAVRAQRARDGSIAVDARPAGG